MTFTLASTSGKTLGTNNNDCTYCNFFFSSGSTNATRAGNIGVQTANISLWGVQLEIGTVATPLEKPDPQQDAAKCQRFYFAGQFGAIGYCVAGGNFAGGFAYLPVGMRAVPSVAIAGVLGTDTNVSAANAPDSITGQSFRFSFTATAAGPILGARSFTASADL